MKVSVCTTWFKHLNIEDVIKNLAPYDINAVEIYAGHISEYLERNADVSNLKHLLKKSKLKVCAIAPYFNFLEENTAIESYEQAKKCVAYAKALDASLVRVFVGHIPSASMTELQYQRCVTYLQKITALDRNIYWGLETHNSQPTDRVQSVQRFIEAVGARNLKVIFDGYNFFVDGIDQVDALQQLYQDTAHVHMKNYLIESKSPVPIHMGDANNDKVLAYLARHGYDGYISLEYFAKEYDTLITQSIDHIRKQYDKIL